MVLSLIWCLLMKFLERNLHIFYLREMWQMTTCFHFVEKQIQIRQSWELVTQLCIEALVQMCD